MSVAAKILCTPCVREDKNVDAVKYCVDCNENFCRACLRLHIKQFSSVSKHHKLLNRNEMPDWLSGSSEHVQNNCARHPQNQLDSFCEDHDILCCGACVVIEHSSCEHVKDLFPLIDEDEPKTEVDVLLQDLQYMIDELKALKDSRRKDQSSLRKSTADSLARVRDFREKVNDIFDELEKQAVEEIDTECIAEDNAIESDIKQTEDSVTFLEMGITQIRDLDKSEKPNLESSLSLVNGKKLLKDMKNMCNEVKSKRKVQRVNFMVNHNIERYISALKKIGTCKKIAMVKNVPVVNVTMYPVNEAGVSAICDIQDAVQTKSGTFLLLDAENKKIKHFNEAFKFIKSFDLIEKRKDEETEHRIYEPFAVCCITNNQIIVSMVRDKVINVYSIGDNLELTNEIAVGEFCRGLAYSGDREEIYVACGGGSFTGEGLGHIRVYTIRGELLKTFQKDRNGKVLTPLPMHLAMGSDELKLFIADKYKGVITMDAAEGKLLATFTAPELAEARGICLDVNDDVIVCGYSSNNVLRVHDDMKTYDTLLTESDKIRNPQALAYDAISSKCLVALNCTNEVCVFEI